MTAKATLDPVSKVEPVSAEPQSLVQTYFGNGNEPVVIVCSDWQCERGLANVDGWNDGRA